jgi:CheY-like chemotaxis protein
MMPRIKAIIINNNFELIQLLDELLTSEGFETRTFQTFDLKTGKVNLQDILKEFKPVVVLYDVAIPYEENYMFFEKIKETVSSELKNTRVILTTTNKDALEEIVGKTNAIEVWGKPFDFDLQELLENLRKEING